MTAILRWIIIVYCYHNNDSTHRSVNVTVIAESFCFINTCTVVMEESNLTLSVSSSTEDRITATNLTNLFVGSLQQPNVRPLFTQIALSCVVIIVAVANITMHFIYVATKKNYVQYPEFLS